MPLTVTPALLRNAAKVAGSVKPATKAKKANFWASVHRISAQGRTLCLETTDNTIWLDWKLQAEGDPEKWDILVPSAKFNDLCNQMSGTLPYTVRREDSYLVFARGEQELRLREQEPQKYPKPTIEGKSADWVVDSKDLSTALNFVAPFLDTSSARPQDNVCTLSMSGQLSGGRRKCIALVEGLTCEHPLNLTQRTAQAISTFLKSCSSEVDIIVAGGKYQIADPSNGHSLTVLGETTEHSAPLGNLEGKQEETLVIERAALKDAVKLLRTVQSPTAERLVLAMDGLMENAVLRIQTVGEDGYISKDSVSADRTLYGGAPDENGEPVAIADVNPKPSTVSVIGKYIADVTNNLGTSHIMLRSFTKHGLMFWEEYSDDPEKPLTTKSKVLMGIQNLNVSDEV